MSGWTVVLLLITSVLLLWFMVRGIRANPQAFSKENLGKSVYTVGVLALIIIAVIFFCVLLLRTA